MPGFASRRFIVANDTDEASERSRQSAALYRALCGSLAITPRFPAARSTSPISAVLRTPRASRKPVLHVIYDPGQFPFKGIKPAFDYFTTNPIGEKLLHRL